MKPEQDKSAESPADESRAFAAVMGGMAIMLAAAFGFSLLFETPLGLQIRLDAEGAFIGVAATLPLVAFLAWFMQSKDPDIAAFRVSQIEFFSQIGFTFTPSRILLMSLGAGVAEEALFRGVFQTFADRNLPVAAAIVLPNILFGLLHARTAMYAAISGGVGIYLGVVFWLSGNLLVPMIAHAVYDVVALAVTRRAIDAKARAEAPVP